MAWYIIRFTVLGDQWQSNKQIYLAYGWGNSCYVTYIKTRNNSGGFCYIFTNRGGRFAAFNVYGISGVNVAGQHKNDWYRIYDSGTWSGFVSYHVIVVSYEPIIAISGHDTPDWNE